MQDMNMFNEFYMSSDSEEIQYNESIYDDSVQRDFDIMNVNVEDRKRYFTMVDNPFGYPEEYYMILQREKSLINLKGYNSLTFANNVLFFNGEKINQNININCIKSRFKSEMDLSIITISGDFYRFLKLNYNYVGTFEQFYDYSLKYDENYKLFKSKVIDNRSDLYLFEKIYEEIIDKKYKDIISKYDQANIYKCLIRIIKHVFGDYSKYVCIAGGFALSMYIYENYKYAIPFSDIDLFIHSCDEKTANHIVSLLENITQNQSYINDNVIVSYFNYSDSDIKVSEKKISIQIIKRLYTCPSQIIHGFDVDCCCILVNLDEDIYVTERCRYAIKNGYNVVNFYRMSPSYEFRLVKYNKRGFGIWIPFSDYFKKTTVFDINVIDTKRLSGIFVKDLISHRLSRYYIENGWTIESKSDYYNKDSNFIKYEGRTISFKTLNPSEQANNTFHKIVLEDPKEWYQVKPDNCIEYNKPLFTKNMIETNEQLDDSCFISSLNILCNIRKSKTYSKIAQNTSTALLKFVTKCLPDCVITGNIPIISLTGRSKINSMNIYSDILFNNVLNYNEFYIQLLKFNTLLKVRNFIFFTLHILQKNKIITIEEKNYYETLLFSIPFEEYGTFVEKEYFEFVISDKLNELKNVIYEKFDKHFNKLKGFDSRTFLFYFDKNNYKNMNIKLLNNKDIINLEKYSNKEHIITNLTLKYFSLKDFKTDNVMYKNGTYTLSEYDYNLYKIGIKDPSMNNNEDIYNFPVYKNFFPC